MKPKVSVMMTTYNHEEFISQAVESVLSQATDFDYELVVGEDCSPDRTREILLGYHSRYPDKIHLLLPEENIGRRNNFIRTFHACRGDYVAILEGDDYWSSNHKLQAQADFLDNHPGYSICFTDAEKYYMEDELRPIRSRSSKKEKETYTIYDLFERNFIRTCSVMFRNGLFEEFPDWYQGMPSGDWPLHVINAQKGKIGFLPETMAVHRVHSGGVWSSRKVSERRKSGIETLEVFQEHLPEEYQSAIRANIVRWHFRILNALLLEKNWKELISYSVALLRNREISKPFLFKTGFQSVRELIR